MMKKLMAILVGIVGIVPFVASAEETANYFTYNKGDIVNFYGNKASQDAKSGDAVETIIFDDKGADDKFVQAWTVGMWTGSAMDVTNLKKDKFYSTDMYAALASDIANRYSSYVEMPAIGGEADSYDYMYDFQATGKEIRLASIEDMVNVLGATKVDGEDKYTFPKMNDKTLADYNGNKQSLLEELTRLFGTSAKAGLEAPINGIMLADKHFTENTSISDPDGAYYWVVKMTWDDGVATNVEIVKEMYDNTTSSKLYMYIPVVYFNKSADCHEHDEPEYCFLCGTTYKFGKGSEVDSTCEKLVDVPKEECANVCYKCATTDTANPFEFKQGRIGDTAFSACEKVADKDCQPKTGKKSYILEFAIVAALCTISLLVVKRKELFKTM